MYISFSFTCSHEDPASWESCAHSQLCCISSCLLLRNKNKQMGLSEVSSSVRRADDRASGEPVPLVAPLPPLA
jgi:hypothetical protein